MAPRSSAADVETAAIAPDTPYEYDSTVIQLPTGAVIPARNVHAWTQVIRCHGALAALAEGDTILPRQVDTILDDLTSALREVGIFAPEDDYETPMLASVGRQLA